MKKQIFTLSLFSCLTFILHAQNGSNQKWSQNGDNVSSGSFLGTSNSEPLLLKSNGILGIKINPNGEVIFKPLDLNVSAPSGLVLTNGQGKISRLDFNGNSNQVLLGNGTWGNFPTAGQWNTSGSNLYWNAGNVGIGTVPNSSFKLTVQGDARVSNDLFVNHDLFVGGGIVITDKVQAVTEVKGWDFKVENDLQVTGASRLSGATRIDQGFSFDGNNGVSYSVVDGMKIVHFGSISGPRPLGGGGANCAAAPYSGVLNQFGGWLQIYDPANPTTSGLMNLQTWTGGSSIDASVGGNLGGGGLLLNYFCHNNTYINTGWDTPNGVNGGTVFMGERVSAARNVGIGSNWPNPNTDVNVGLNVFANDDKMDAVRINVWNGSVKAINLVNPGNGISNFIVFQNGKTQIGNLTQKTGQHTDAMLTVNGKAVAQSFYVTTSSWSDYVFADNYKMKSLEQIESYYKTYKHLPEIPSEKEVIENGINVAEMNELLLKKIEELTILMVEQNKQIKAQGEEILKLKSNLPK